jgi:hypothetical protein
MISRLASQGCACLCMARSWARADAGSTRANSLQGDTHRLGAASLGGIKPQKLGWRVEARAGKPQPPVARRTAACLVAVNSVDGACSCTSAAGTQQAPLLPPGSSCATRPMRHCLAPHVGGAGSSLGTGDVVTGVDPGGRGLAGRSCPGGCSQPCTTSQFASANRTSFFCRL